MLSTVVCAIAASSAVHVLAGQGGDVVLVSIGMAIGLGFSSYIGVSNWLIFIEKVDLIAENISVISMYLPVKGSSVREVISPKIAMALATPASSEEFSLETEVRGLLDAVARLGRAVVVNGFCHCCSCQGGHAAGCDYVRSMELHELGCSKRVAWSEFRQQLEYY
ncbi:MAG: hypothetical protein WA885_04815 [Phormidesmis sp.]